MLPEGQGPGRSAACAPRTAGHDAKLPASGAGAAEGRTIAMGTTGPANLDDRIRPNSETKSERVIHRRARAQCYARGGAARGRCQRKANFRGARTGFPSVGSGGLPSGTCASRWICASTSARTIMAAEAGGSRPRRGREPRDRSKDATGTRPSVPCSRGRSGVEFYNTARPHSALGYRPPAPEVVMPLPPVPPSRPGLAGAAQPSSAMLH